MPTRLQPAHLSALLNLGNCLQLHGDIDSAIATYLQIIDTDPNCAEAYNNLGHALLIHGRAEDAVEACRRAVRFKPDLADAYNNLGNALRFLGEVDEAVAAHVAGAHAPAGFRPASTITMETCHSRPLAIWKKPSPLFVKLLRLNPVHVRATEQPFWECSRSRWPH